MASACVSHVQVPTCSFGRPRSCVNGKRPAFLCGQTPFQMQSIKCRRQFRRPAQVSAYLADSLSENLSQVLRTVGLDPEERRLALLLAVGTQAGRKTEQVVEEAAKEASRYVNPRRSQEPRSLEEALMSTPDLETIPYTVVKQTNDYDIREVESYYVAEVDMGSRPFDFAGAGNSFNTLADYLFGNNSVSEGMEMTTPVLQRRGEAMEMTTPVITRQEGSGRRQGEAMEMTTPVITRRGEAMEMTTPVINRQAGSANDSWRMSFVLPKDNVRKGVPQPKNPAVQIHEVPAKTVAVVAFSGFVNDQEVANREAALRSAVARDLEFRVKAGATPEVAQFNPPFTLPFLRRNEVSLEVERISL